MTDIAATTVSCRTLVDGTLRLVLDIEPGAAVAAFGLFGVPGRAVGLAALKPADSTLTPMSEIVQAIRDGAKLKAGPFIAKPDESTLPQSVMVTKAKLPKGGALAKLAGQWCNDPVFAEWLFLEQGYVLRHEEGDPAFCRRYILGVCRIQSRAELDHNPQAAAAFHTLIREPFAEYLKTRTK